LYPLVNAETTGLSMRLKIGFPIRFMEFSSMTLETFMKSPIKKFRAGASLKEIPVFPRLRPISWKLKVGIPKLSTDIDVLI